MHPCISIRGFARPSVRWSVDPSVRRSVRHTSAIFAQNKEPDKKGPHNGQLDNLGKFGQVWASLGRSGQVWASLGKFGQTIDLVFLNRFICSVIHRFIHSIVLYISLYIGS